MVLAETLIDSEGDFEACDGTQVVDMQDWQAVRSSIAKSKEEMDGLDGVAVCIGSLLLKPAHLTSQEEWNDVMHTHVAPPLVFWGLPLMR